MSALPPGPRSGLLTMLGYLRDPYGSTLRLFARHGDPCTVRSLGPPLVSTGDPELIRTILSADPDTYEAFGVDLMAPVLGRESLILLSGERHRVARKLLAPPFHGARMRSYGRAMQAVARDEAQRWQPGRPFALQDSTQAISLRIILGAVFGVTHDGRRWEEALVATIKALKPSLMFMKFLQNEFGGFGPWARLMRHRRIMEQLVEAEIAARGDEPREDILSLILSARYDDGSRMDGRQVFETLMTIVVAGHETSAIAIAWALYFVYRNKRVRERLQAELAGVDDPEAIVRLPFLEAVCHETLRLRPVAGTIIRMLVKPLTLGEWNLQPGVGVSPSITMLHRQPALYPEPEQFRPERFLERSFAPWEYLPFGGGSRRCIGAAFALYEMKIVLATLMAQPLELVSDRPIPATPRSTVIGAARPILFRRPPAALTS